MWSMTSPQEKAPGEKARWQNEPNPAIPMMEPVQA